MFLFFWCCMQSSFQLVLSLSSPLGKGHSPLFEQPWIFLIHAKMLHVKFGWNWPRVLEKSFNVVYVSVILICYYLPLKKGMARNTSTCWLMLPISIIILLLHNWVKCWHDLIILIHLLNFREKISFHYFEQTWIY